MKKYFIHVNGSSVGPYSFEDLRSMRIQKTTPVWYDGLGAWQIAGNVSELRPLFSSNASTFTTSQNYSKPDSRSTHNFTNDNLSGNIGGKKSSGKIVGIIVGAVILVFAGAGFLIYQQEQRKKEMLAEMMYELERSDYESQNQQAIQDAMDSLMTVTADAAPPEEIVQYGASTYAGRFNNYSGGVILVTGTDENHLLITIKFDPAYGCSGEVSGIGSLIEKNTIQMKTSSGCKIKIKYSNRIVTVEESSACSADHGNNCSFDGIYSREK